jgi:hypothetical protein
LGHLRSIKSTVAIQLDTLHPYDQESLTRNLTHEPFWKKTVDKFTALLNQLENLVTIAHQDLPEKWEMERKILPVT